MAPTPPTFFVGIAVGSCVGAEISQIARRLVPQTAWAAPAGQLRDSQLRARADQSDPSAHHAPPSLPQREWCPTVVSRMPQRRSWVVRDLV